MMRHLQKPEFSPKGDPRPLGELQEIGESTPRREVHHVENERPLITPTMEEEMAKWTTSVSQILTADREERGVEYLPIREVGWSEDTGPPYRQT